jgi:L-2-hydroxyglutarate oxidase LhgO
MSSPSFDVDVTVIGAGVVGLAVAAELCRTGLSVFILERNSGPGRETSSRNSEVIHAGIYYPTGSQKARLCVLGNRLLYQYCAERGVEHRAIGKLIIATTVAEISELERLYLQGNVNGALGLRMIDRQELRRIEPSVQALAALYSPSTGIIDSHGLIKSLEAETCAGGGQIFFRCQVIGIEAEPTGYRIIAQNPSGQETIKTRFVINAAGLESDRIATLVGLSTYRLWWCKGDYFSIAGGPRDLVTHLIYPTPGHGLTSLGIHVTIDLSDRIRLGPDAVYIMREKANLDVDSNKAQSFFQAVQQFLPQIQLNDLCPDTSGIRPKLQGPGQPWEDFLIREEKDSGFPCLVNLIGIESPGLTSCLAIAKEVHQLLKNYIKK